MQDFDVFLPVILHGGSKSLHYTPINNRVCPIHSAKKMGQQIVKE